MLSRGLQLHLQVERQWCLTAFVAEDLADSTRSGRSVLCALCHAMPLQQSLAMPILNSAGTEA